MLKKKAKASSVTKRLDKLLSIAVRLRDTDDYGNGHCCTCGCLLKYADSDAGHFIGRGRFGTRYDLRNVALQCRVCNRGEGKQPEFYEYVLGQHGRDVMEELKRLCTRHAPDLDLDVIRATLLAEIAKYRSQKMFNIKL